jgi:hypothetical protein
VSSRRAMIVLIMIDCFDFLPGVALLILNY